MPEKDPPSIRLKDQVYTWKEGESVLFDDSWEHEVYNRCESDRVVLIVDIRRPMPQPFDGVNRVAQAVMKRVYGGHMVKKLAQMTPPGTTPRPPCPRLSRRSRRPPAPDRISRKRAARSRRQPRARDRLAGLH